MSFNLSPSRVRFYNGQYLQAEDLVDEQNYHVQMRWRHNLALHSWGIVAGLNAEVEGSDPKQQQLKVHSGMAIDGYGRELVLTADVSIPLNDRNSNEILDIWIYYQLVNQPGTVVGCSRSMRSVGLADRDSDRQDENPRIVLRPTSQSQSPDPSRPDEVPPGELATLPQRPLPLGDEEKWPVFLGRLAFREGPGWVVDGSLRRPAGLLAGQIQSPANDRGARTVIVNGSQPNVDPFTFAVFSPVYENSDDPNNKPNLGDRSPVLAVRAADGSGSPARVAFTADRVRVAADMTFKDGAALDFQPNLIQGANHADIPRGAENWRIYHHFEPPPRTKPDGTAEGGFSDELRITMPAGEEGSNRVVIGSFSDKGKFTPILAVLDNQRVEIYGTLQVNKVLFGTLSDAPEGQSGATGAVAGERAIRALVDRMKSGDVKSDQLINALADATTGGPSLWETVAESVPQADAAKVIDPVADNLWKTDPGADALGLNATSNETRFLRFLNKIPGKGLSQTAVFSQWAFADAARPERLVEGFPTKSDNPGLAALAEKLVATGNEEKLQALLQAIADATGAGGEVGVDKLAAGVANLKDGKLGALLRDLSEANAQAVAEALASKKKSAEAAKAFLKGGNAGDFLNAVGSQLPTTVADVKPLLDGANAAQRQAVASALFTDDNGMRAVSAALSDDLSSPPVNFSDTAGKLVRTYVKFVKDLGGPITLRLGPAIRLLGENFNSI